MKPKDFVVSCYCVYNGKVALIYHTKLGMWLPLGGHIEEGESLRDALVREVREESGLDVEISEEDKVPDGPGKLRELIKPDDIQEEYINEEHNHINFVYFLKAKTGELVLKKDEHKEIKWFGPKELDDRKLNIHPRVKEQSMRAVGKFK